MPIELNTPRAKELQDSIQRELAVKGWASENDHVMAEFITIMMINSKSADQITLELTELIGEEYDPEFTTWLFSEAADDLEGELIVSGPSSTTIVASLEAHPSTARPIPTAPRGDSAAASAPSKRPRSPSDSGPGLKKAPRTSDLPDRPRAMTREDGSQPIPVHNSRSPSNGLLGRPEGGPNSGGRSLLDRMGPAPPRFGPNGQPHHQNSPHNNFRPQNPQQPMFDPIQAQIEAVTAANGGMLPPFMNPQMMQIDPNQMQIRDLMQGQVMVMAQMQQMMQQFGAVQAQAALSGGFAAHPQANGGGFPGRGRGRGGISRGVGRGGAYTNSRPSTQADVPKITEVGTPTSSSPVLPAAVADSEGEVNIILPKPSAAFAPQAFAYPERPGTPTLCKFATACTNPVCRYSHPSPAATAETGLVLSVEACENGIKCVDKDCTKSHPSPAILDPNATVPVSVSSTSRSTVYAQPKPPHRFNPYSKPFIPSFASGNHPPCKFGANCTRAACAFQHPPGRTTLPGEFHRGLKDSDPTLRVVDPGREKTKSRVIAAGAAIANRYNKTMTFNKPKPASASNTSTPAASADGAVNSSPDPADVVESSNAKESEATKKTVAEGTPIAA